MQAQGVRLEWDEVPEDVRSRVAAALGSPVVTAVNQPGGFSPGVAARCRLADGRRCFIKSVSPEPNPSTPDLHRREAEVASALPPHLPVPALLDVIDDGTWVTLVFEEIEGQPPAQPWSMEDLAATFGSLEELAAATTPCPVVTLPSFVERHRAAFAGYRTLAGGGAAPVDGLDPWTRRHLDALAALEDGWEDAAAGSSLLHSDLRADNLLVTPDGAVVVVDWPHACIGPAWVDKACMLPSVGLGGGPSPAEVVAALDPFGEVEPEALDLVLVALCGYFTHQGAQPDPPGLPTVRAFQRAQGAVAREWLMVRLRLQ
ncbi:MAG TPA: aminoglycoside phosphotransferase family protein [Acidimicrobiales bacterium]|nr:aminoglycoside phosphotransferase family protein [Acidimicrobiales bacterium]